MNIVVRHLDGSCSCRPDTTWERENKDIYAIPAVNAYRFTPVLFVRVSKAGKCVGYRFAQRYYDGFNFGVLLYGGLRPGIPPKEQAEHDTDYISGHTTGHTTNHIGGHTTGHATDYIGGAEELHWSSCLDHSSILPFPLYNPLVLENDDKEFVFRKNGTVLFRTGEGSADTVENAIAEVSELVSLRIGDIIAVELQKPADLALRGEDSSQTSDCILQGDFLDTETFSHRLIW